MRHLLGSPASGGPPDLADVYAFPTPADGGPTRWVRATFVASADGAAQGGDHRSGRLSSDADKRVFALQRSLCDAILVGAATTRVERYRRVQPGEVDASLRERLGLAPLPTIVVVSWSMDLDPRLVEGQGGPLVVVTGSSADEALLASTREHADVLVCDGASLDARAVVELLAGRGLTRIHCEGGPTLLSAVVVAGVLDDLCLTTAPLLVGGDRRRILHGVSVEPPARLRLADLLEDDGFLFARYLVERA